MTNHRPPTDVSIPTGKVPIRCTPNVGVTEAGLHLTPITLLTVIGYDDYGVGLRR